MLDVKRKVVSGILLILLLVSILTPIFNIQQAKSSEAGTLDILVSDHPDPFNPLYGQNTITITNNGTISVEVFLALGALSPVIPGFPPRTWEWESVENGTSVQAIWDGKDGAENIVPAGVYNYTAGARQLNDGVWFEETGTITVIYESIESESPWPMFGYDSKHTGQSPYIGAQDAIVKWSYPLEDGVFSEPVIDSKNVIYIRTGKGVIYAINPNVTLKWDFFIGGNGESCYGSLAIGKDGTVYAGTENFGCTYDRTLYALNQDGTLKWKFSTSASPPPAIGTDTSITIGPDGTIYFIGTETVDDQLLNVLYVLNSDGSIKWNSVLEGYAHSAPAIGDDGSIYLASQKVWAFTSTGELIWSFSATDDSYYGQPIVGSDGTIYMRAIEPWTTPGGQNLIAIHPEGTLNWRVFVDTAGHSRPRPVISKDGTIYLAGTVGKYIIAISSSDGFWKWSYETNAWFWPSTPVVGADGTIYIGTEFATFSAINPIGTLKWLYVAEEAITIGPYYTPAAIGSDGTIYVASYSIDGNHKLYAFGPGPTPPENQPPTCSIKLKKDGVEISEIDVGEFFDIYVGDSTDDTGIKQVRFSSDDVQDSIPTGQWTQWYDWDSFLDDWDATTKNKRWSFSTAGYKEVWAEVKDDIGQTTKCSANIFVPAPALPMIISTLVVTPMKDIYWVGDSLTAEFTIKNIGDVAITLDVLTVGGRLNGWCPDEGCPDFTHRSATLQPDESYQYEGSLTLTQSGNYRFFVAYYIENPTADEKSLLDENNWNTCVQLGEGLTNVNRVKNIFALEHPDTVSELRDRINRELRREVIFSPYLLGEDSFTSAVATLWMDFTSWATRTHLNNLYDEFYKTGIDYECLRVTVLINARKALDRGDIPSAEKYLEQSYTYNKLSYMSFTAAFEVYDVALDAGEILAEGIKKGCEASRRIVMLALKITNPVAAKAADYVFLAVDYAVDYKLVGEEEATKNAIVKIAVMLTFDEIKYEYLGGRTISEFTRDRIGEVTFPILQNIFKNEVHFEYLASKIYTRIIEEIGVEIEESVAEDIAKRIWNMLEEGVDLERAEVKSPVALRVYDSQGRITGLLNRETRHEISRSLYYNGTVTTFFPFDIYHYEVVGTDDGTYGLEITSVRAGNVTEFTATDIPTSVNATHQYTVDWDALSLGEEGVTLLIDSDGNGVFEGIVSSDNELTYDEFLLQMVATTIDFDPDTLNLESKGEWVTVYIEFPEGYDVVDIDVPTIELYECDTLIERAELNPTEIGDYDDDDIPDLMVKFDRASVIELISKDDDKVTLKVFGKFTDGTIFTGEDTIKVVNKVVKAELDVEE